MKRGGGDGKELDGIQKASVGAMQEAERLAEKVYGIDPWSMMQEAGYRVADVVRRQYGKEETVAVVAGPGNNAGDGLVAASRLFGWGYDVFVVAGTRDLQNPALQALSRTERLDVPVREEISEAAVCIDAVFGYGLEGAPRPPYDGLLRDMEGSDVVAVDVPSGVNANTGETTDPHVKPNQTVMLGLPKQGLNATNAGKMWLADIGLPASVYEAVGVQMPFEESSLFAL